MSGTRAAPRIPLQLLRGCLVASIQIDLDPEILRQFRQDLLERIHAAEACGVILDVAGVAVLDAEDFDALRKTMSMASVMGARTVLAGLRPGVVSALMDMGVDTEGVRATLDLDDAFRLLDAPPPAAAAADVTGGAPEAEPGSDDPDDGFPTGAQAEARR